MAANEQVRAWLDSDTPELVATIVSDIQRHVTTLRSSGDSFYGYAVLPGNYCTQPNPASIATAFNRETDIAPEHANDSYYRYSVDEWKNYVHDGFEATNSLMESWLEQFRELHSRQGDSYQLDEFEVAFVAKTNRAILDALMKLKRLGTFDNETYLIIWFSDADYEIMDESARALNDSEVYEQYASEFQ